MRDANDQSAVVSAYRSLTKRPRSKRRFSKKVKDSRKTQSVLVEDKSLHCILSGTFYLHTQA